MLKAQIPLNQRTIDETIFEFIGKRVVDIKAVKKVFGLTIKLSGVATEASF